MAGYHFPAVMVRCKRAPAVRTVMHCHANACDIGHIYELCQRDAECWQANVLLVEYPGYGTSPGTPYERSVDRHVMVAYQYLTEELRCKPESIVLFGRSLGSGPVCRLAQRLQEQGEKVGGLILHSPFISVKEVGVSLLGGVANVISDRWDNRVPCAVVRCRLLIIHGASDEVVPFAHAEALRDARKANGLHCTFFPTQGTHNYFSYYRDYLHPVENFLTQHTARKMPPLPDPLPMARYSRAQVKEIVELRKKRASQAAAREHQSAGGATPARARGGPGHHRRSGSGGGGAFADRRVGRDGSPNSTLAEGGDPGGEGSGPTSSDDEGDGARFNARDAGRTPGPTKPKWSKERGREVVATRGGKEEQDPRWADDGLISGIPGGASPFGGKSKPPAGVTSRK